MTKINILDDATDPAHPIGEVFRINEKIVVQTAAGVISLEELQLEGKANTPVTNFINGYPNFVGSILE